MDVHRTLDAVWKLESAKIVAALTRMVHDVGLAEELAQEALVSALEQWTESGVPGNPAAWLTAVAKRRAVDHIRRSRLRDRTHEHLARELDRPPGDERDEQDEQGDILRLMFLACHPILEPPARVALTLKLLGGLTNAEIARAFLVAEPVVARRIADAKRVLADRRVPFALPEPAELAGRLSSVLEVIYLIFNEGYSATAGDDLLRPGLCLEALRLGRMLAELAPREAEVHGLVALMEIQASRTAARTGPSGEPVQLHEQNRGRWDRLLIRRGFTSMLRAREAGGTPGPYLLQAAIAVCHAQARTAEETDWKQIATLYEALARLLPTPVVQLNRAVALGMAYGPRAGLELADSLAADPALRDYHLLPSVRGDLLLRLGRRREARLEFERAASLTRNAAERAFLRRRAGEIADGPAGGATLGEAVRGFLGRDDLDPQTIRSYGQTLRRLCRGLGEELPLGEVTAERVSRVFAAAWGTAAARTWNRHRSAVRSFGAWAGLGDLAAGLERRAAARTEAVAVSPGLLDALSGVSPRERVMWRLLHDSAAPVTAVLALNVEDLDLERRQARVGKVRVRWSAETGRLLAALVAGRRRGPLFLSDRRPAPARRTAQADLCAETGRRRLSYERAEYLFKQATKPLDPAGRGYTLRQLRPRP
ncbi:sigma-70 family RNA polymerase sigma factor [Thermoactinospora rubra]|uniref:sigma-70 family RNA polymerase sigma factor n=1 Tax=Thermoactinospora rubra TaxID=1088767 RepID=UPI001F0AD95B|nr:sigma-70 family RNA polymerase sigma factor [Thermoactinospora rubra]